MRTRKILLGLAATAAVLTATLIGGSANAAVSADQNCQPVQGSAAWVETLYKWSPVKSSDGPTQWTTDNPPANTPRQFVVKGKNVNYFRDGVKTSTVVHPAVEEVTCATTFVVDLPDTFDDTREFDGQTYAFTKVTRDFTNTTDTDYVIHVQNADQQDDNQIWVERTVFDNWYHDVVIPAHSTKTLTFDVWYDVANYGADVPDNLTLTYQVSKNFTWA